MKRLFKRFAAVMLSVSMIGSPSLTQYLSAGIAFAEEGSELKTEAAEQEAEAVEQETEAEIGSENADSFGDEKPDGGKSDGTLSDGDKEELDKIFGKTELDRKLENDELNDKNSEDSEEAEEGETQEKNKEELDGSSDQSAGGKEAEEETEEASEEENEAEENEAEEEETGEEGNPFNLADEDMPASYEDLFGDMENVSIMTADADSGSDDSAYVTYDSKGQASGNLVFKYTSVSNKEKTFTVTKDMKATVDLLTLPNTQEFDGVKYYGFSILSLAIEVTKGNSTLVFFANDFVGDNFYVNAYMELNSGDKFTDTIYYNSEPFSEKSSWSICAAADVKLDGGKYTIKVRKPYGGYVASKEAIKKEASGRALLIYQSGDESLGTGPQEDAWALYSTLARTKQFKASDITVFDAPESTSEDLKAKIWKWIDEQAGKDGITLIAYTGHGNYNGDGTSELSLGGSNAISAVELKNHVSKLKGKVILIFDCCFSGGMIMPTALDIGDELEETSYEELAKAAQDEADKSIKSFVNDFKNAKSDSKSKAVSSGSTGGSPEYYIYAAASAYETSIQDSNGGQLIETLGRALGYNRNYSEYNVFAADKNADYKITAKELADFVKAGCTKAVPSIYPSESSTQLFTYDKEVGTPAVITATATETKNVIMSADGTISVKVNIKNHSSNKITVDAILGSMDIDSLYSPGSIQSIIDNVYASEKDYLLYTANKNKQTIDAKKDKTVTLTFKAAKKDLFSGGGRFLIRIGGTDGTSEEYYDVVSFYIAKSGETSGYAAAPNKKAFSVLKPVNVKAAAEAFEASAIVPVEVTFDDEPTEKSGYADCTLTAEYLPISEADKSKYTADNGSLMLNGTEKTDGAWTAIYKDVRPSYVRNDVYSEGSKTVTGSTYSYDWDVSKLTNGCYAVRISCKYSDNTENKWLTFIQKVDSTDSASRVINNLSIDIRDFAKYGNGFPVGSGWDAYNSDLKTVEKVSENLQRVLDTYAQGHGADSMSYKVYSNGNDDFGWYEYVDDGGKGKLVNMKATDKFEAGKSYVTGLTVTINDKNAKFADGATIKVPGHDVLNAAISDDKKSADVWFIHTLVKPVDESKLKVYLMSNNTQLTKDSKLKVGDKIKVYAPDGYEIYTEDDWGNLREDKDAGKGKDYRVYEVLGNKSYISLYMYAASSLSAAGDKDGCDCATVAFTCDLGDTKGGITRITVPDKTFYNKSAKAKLDLSGALVDYYNKEYKKQTNAKLADFIKNNKLKVYYLSGGKYIEWNDKYLNTLGTYALYVNYNNKYTKICDIAVGYEQGTSFSIKGDLTTNISGSANYLSDEQKKNAVLFLNVKVEPAYTDAGTVYITHNVGLKQEGMDVTSYTKLYPDSDCRISYLIPYAGGITKNTTFQLIDENVNVPVTFKVQNNGILITAAKNGSFKLKYLGGKGGPADDDSSSSNSGRHGSASDRRDHVGKTYGSWVSEATADGSLGADGQPLTRFRYKLTDGNYAKGWQIISYNNADTWFHFDSDGFMNTGWIKDGASWYYLKSSGAMSTGWLQDNGAWYYMDQNGSMKTGWALVGDKWYYLDADGKMVTGTQVIDQKTYVFDANGALAS